MRTYGRMADPKNHRDVKAMGGNPCLEQTLESFEMCCLVETFPNKHDSLDDFLETLRLKDTGYMTNIERYRNTVKTVSVRVKVSAATRTTASNDVSSNACLIG